jgi:hypothetical protein
MKYLKARHLEHRVLVAVAWALWVITFSMGFILAKVTF